MNERSILFCGKDGRWKAYDDSYDITIHCESKREKDEMLDLLGRAWCDATTSAKNAATLLKDFCKGQNNMDPNCCEKCIFSDKKDGSCLIANEVPEDWRV